MDYSVFFQRTLERQGLDLVAQFNCFEPPYNADTGWPLKLPEVDFRPNTLLLLHFQDFVTVQDNFVVELTRVEQHYRDRAGQVLVTHWPHNLRHYYSGPINLIEFNSHEYSLIKNLRDRHNTWQSRLIRRQEHQWQCLNGRKCSHRTRAVAVLQRWGQGMLSYGANIMLPQWPYSTYFGTENEENFLRLLDVYAACSINIVTETQYEQAPGIITEKTIFAMLAGQIPIVIGYPGIVADCVDLGFDMFTDLVDIRYDRAPNDIRVEMALESNRDLILGRVDLSPYHRRLRCQQQFVLDHYPRLLEARFMVAAESLARSWPGIL